jgi:hypothetical protein
MHYLEEARQTINTKKYLDHQAWDDAIPIKNIFPIHIIDIFEAKLNETQRKEK